GQHADGSVAYRAHEAKGVRRRRILTHVDRVRDISDRQSSSPTTPLQIDSPALPDKLGAGEAEHLQEAPDALYAGMWALFRSEVGVGLEKTAGRGGDVFANLRGLVMDTEGLTGGAPTLAPRLAAGLSSKPLPVFAGDPAKSGEAHAVVKAF